MGKGKVKKAKRAVKASVSDGLALKWEEAPPLRTRASRHAPLLELLAKNRGREARIGAWPKDSTAQSCINSLRRAADARKDARLFVFKRRQLGDSSFAVYAVYGGK